MWSVRLGSSRPTLRLRAAGCQRTHPLPGAAAYLPPGLQALRKPEHDQHSSGAGCLLAWQEEVGTHRAPGTMSHGSPGVTRPGRAVSPWVTLKQIPGLPTYTQTIQRSGAGHTVFCFVLFFKVKSQT